MADNYLENKFEQLYGGNCNKKVIVKKLNPSLDTLLHKNRSVRGYDNSISVSYTQLKEIVKVNTLIASGKNRQALRFRIVDSPEEAALVMQNIKMGGALPDLHLPLPNTEPTSFIVVCAYEPEDRLMDIDLGISLQSMSLKTVEMGFNCLIVCSIDKQNLMSCLGLELIPLAVLCVGKSKENIFLKPVSEGENLSYYRKDGIQYVPKLRLEDLLIVK